MVPTQLDWPVTSLFRIVKVPPPLQLTVPSATAYAGSEFNPKRARAREIKTTKIRLIFLPPIPYISMSKL
jgi:hypothetical protein